MPVAAEKVRITCVPETPAACRQVGDADLVRIHRMQIVANPRHRARRNPRPVLLGREIAVTLEQSPQKLPDAGLSFEQGVFELGRHGATSGTRGRAPDRRSRGVRGPNPTQGTALGVLQCARNQGGRGIEHAVSPALLCCRTSLMHHAWIDCAQCPGWHDERGRPAGPEALPTRLDDANGERFMQMGGKTKSR